MVGLLVDDPEELVRLGGIEGRRGAQGAGRGALDGGRREAYIQAAEEYTPLASSATPTTSPTPSSTASRRPATSSPARSSAPTAASRCPGNPWRPPAAQRRTSHRGESRLALPSASPSGGWLRCNRYCIIVDGYRQGDVEVVLPIHGDLVHDHLEDLFALLGTQFVKTLAHASTASVSSRFLAPLASRAR